MQLRLRWSQSLKLTLISLSVGASVLTFLSWYLKRKRRPKSREKIDGYPSNTKEIAEIASSTRSNRESRRSRHNVSMSSRTSTLKGSRRTEETYLDAYGDLASYSGTECGRLGLHALQNVINHLEDAMLKFRQFETSTPEKDPESEFVIRELQALLEQAYSVRERCKQKLILQVDDYVPSSDSESETESFVSAAEFIDISDLEEQLSTCQKNLMYGAALVELDNGNIHYRCVRTRMVGCETDTEYLAKLHCLRQAFDRILSDRRMCSWMKNAGRELMSRLLNCLGYDHGDYEKAYDSMIVFLEEPENRAILTEDLDMRNVKVVNFFDIVFDMMLLDAFQDMSNPPSSLVSVIHNRWLSNGFKKTALYSAVYTLLLTKKKMLKNRDGFTAHFYDIVATIGPALAWGFMGPEEQYNEICTIFKDNIMSFVYDIFNSEKTRFTSVDDVAQDIFSSAKDVEKKLIHILNNSM